MPVSQRRVKAAVITEETDVEKARTITQYEATIPDSVSTFASDPDEGDKRTKIMGKIFLINYESRSVMLLFSVLVFVVLFGAGVAIFWVLTNSHSERQVRAIRDLAIEIGRWFSKELDYAILPLFSMAQFAVELEMFASLPDRVEKRPFLPYNATDLNSRLYRNVTGICDDAQLIRRFDQLASNIKESAQMDGVLHSIQLAPGGIICLVNPINNTEDFDDGVSFLDNTDAFGLDLLNDAFFEFIARQSMKQETVGIAGPRPLLQCPDCGMYFIARLPVISRSHMIEVDGVEYPRWGFATALIHWDTLIKRSSIYETLAANSMEFLLTRTDYTFNETAGEYFESVVHLAQSQAYGSKRHSISHPLQTTNNEWILTIQFNQNPQLGDVLALVVSFVVAVFVALLVYTVLLQKKSQATMRGLTMAEKAKAEVERHFTAALAHELRNPLGAIDSALNTMPDNIPAEAKELVESMKLCSNFMSRVMNNLLDSRKLEEGKLGLLRNVFSIKILLRETQKMMSPACHGGVDLLVDDSAIPPGKEWVFGDVSRMGQVLTNITSNAIKFTSLGSIVLSAKIIERDGTEWIRYVCSDTGPGIPIEDQARLFQRFITRGGAPGSGLGLTISRQILDLMGGSIHFESDPTVKQGTDCVVLVPLEVCDEVQSEGSGPPINSSFQSNEAIQESIRVLIVDDIQINRTMLKRRFEKSIAPNCVIFEAATGEEALKICEEEEFHVIVMDQYMAGGVLLGTDVVIALRRNKIDAIVIGCSGNDLDEPFFKAGANLVWKKPIPSNSEIIQSLRSLLVTLDIKAKR